MEFFGPKDKMALYILAILYTLAIISLIFGFYVLEVEALRLQLLGCAYFHYILDILDVFASFN
jgi:hypothetical protein